MPDYLVTLLGKFFCFATVAVAMDLLWGYAGILSLGHGVFFALGGYAMGMYLMLSIGEEGVYRSKLPDFMVFLDWKELPWFWRPFDNFGVALLAALLVPGLLAYVFGFFAFRSRIRGVYFSIITQAFTFALMLFFFRNETGLGGNNGLTNFKHLYGYPLAEPSTKLALYVFSVLGMLLAFLLCRFVVQSKAGRVLRAIRDSESRVMFAGYNPTSFKLFVYTLSAVICGLAGALYVPQVGIINPSELQPANSIEMAIWVAVGGRGSLIGGRARRVRGQRRQELVHRRAAGALALRARRAVHRRYAVFPRRHCGCFCALAAVVMTQTLASSAAVGSEPSPGATTEQSVVTPSEPRRVRRRRNRSDRASAFCRNERSSISRVMPR